MGNNLPIGFFDSGVGGLSVYARFRKLLPNENTIYFGDLKNLPYGNKSKEALISFARRILDFFKSKNVKSVVIACNTSSALAYDEVKNDYDFPIYPIIQSCAKVISQLDIERIGIFATVSTINSGVYEEELHKYNPSLETYAQGCHQWVDIVESHTQNNAEKIEIVKFDLDKMLEHNPQKIILGCTHYPFLLDVLSKFADREMFIDPADYFVDFIKTDLEQSNLLNVQEENGSEEFYVSANPEQFKLASKMFYDVKDAKEITLD